MPKYQPSSTQTDYTDLRKAARALTNQNWCVSCLRVIQPSHRFDRHRCDACIDADHGRNAAIARHE